MEWEKKGDIYLADCDIDRHDTDAVVGYLKNKYGKPHLIDKEMKGLSTTVGIPHQGEAQQPPGAYSNNAADGLTGNVQE